MLSWGLACCHYDKPITINTLLTMICAGQRSAMQETHISYAALTILVS